MVREQLQTAAADLTTAAENADGEAADRLGDLSEQLETLADRDSAPDHGRLARIQNALHDIKADVDEAVTGAIDDANEAINAFREKLEGV